MTHCGICAFAEEHGYTEGNDAHCRICHRSWGGLAEAHCGKCHRQFGGMTAFDAHMRGDVCRDPAGVKVTSGAPRFRVVMRKHGAVWVQASDESGFTRRSRPRRTA